MKLKGFNLVNLKEMIDVYSEEEDKVKNILLSFSSINKDVEFFLHKRAIEFAKKDLSQTHLLFASHRGQTELIAYFTISSKFLMVRKNALSTTLRKRISKFGNYHEALKQYLIGAPLIAQLGKNYTNNLNELITGDELLKMACEKVKDAQRIIGGKIVYLECEDIVCLKDFYIRNGFVEFGKRKLDKDETDRLEGEYLVQLMKYLK